jgi:hypothetical protein
MDTREEATKRNRITLYLLLAGGAILVIPLLILLYLRSSETSSSGPNAAFHPFAHRESVADRIKAAQTPAPAVLPSNLPAGTAGPVQSQNSASEPQPESLGLIKGGSDFLPPQSAKTQAPPPPAPQQQAVAKNDPAPASKTKSFKQPHLQGTGFGGAGQRGAQMMGQRGQMGQIPPGGMPQISGGTLQMPGGTPQMPGGMPQMPGGAGMSDMSKLMQGMMPGAAATGAGAVNPGGAQQGNAPSAGTQQKQ